MEAGGGWSGREAEMEDGCTEWEDGRGEKGPAEVDRWREAEVNGARADFHLIIAALHHLDLNLQIKLNLSVSDHLRLSWEKHLDHNTNLYS